MNKLIFLSFALATLFAQGQNDKRYKESSDIGVISKTTNYKQTTIGVGANEESILAYLENNHNAQLALSFYKESPVAHYYLFQQEYNGIPIYGAEIKITLNKKGVIIREDNGLVDVPNNFNPVFTSSSSIYNEITKGREVISHSENPYIMVLNNRFIEVVEYKIHFASHEHELYLIDNNAEVVLKKDLNLYHTSVDKDTIADLMIYNPDPLTKVSKTYGGIYIDLGDENTAVLDPLRDTAKMTVTFKNNLFVLENDYCVIRSVLSIKRED